jgi:hypothetical protein
MRSDAIIPLGDYLPDLGPFGNPGCTVAKNALPFNGYYSCVKNPVDYSSNSLSGTARGFISTRDDSGVAYAYAGDISALYRLSNLTFSDASRTSGGDYNLQSDDAWEFVKWGDKVVATNYTDDLQVITMGASNFAALAGSPPRARHMAVVRDFLVLGNVTDFSDSSSAKTSRVHWSGFNNIETWEPSIATQADFQDLRGEGGWVQRIIGGEYGVIFQERSIQRMTFIGSPLVWQFDEVERGKGTPAPWSVIQAAGKIYYLGQDDFYMFTGVSTPIGHSRVYKTFIKDLDESYYERIWAGADPKLQIVYWLYPGANNNNGTPNKMLVYNWGIDKWAGPWELELDLLCQVQAEGYTVETLDNINTSLDALPFSLDSREYMGQALNFAAFNTSNTLQTFEGTDMTATFETGDRQPFKGRRALITNSRPLVEGDSASPSVAISSRGKLNESATFGSAVSINADGECPVIREGRYLRTRVNIVGGFTHAQGVEVQAESGGEY